MYELNFNTIRPLFPGKKLTQRQVDGILSILAACHDFGITDKKQTAYILATAIHETAFVCHPVIETLAKTPSQASARLERAFKAGKLRFVKTPYWRKDKDGNIWLGRGYVQLTHKRNYCGKMQDLVLRAFNEDICKNPDLVLEPNISIFILIRGMEEGLFTGKKLSSFLGGSRTRWGSARAVVNPGDKSGAVTKLARAVFVGLSKADGKVADTVPPTTEPVKPSSKDKPLARLIEAILKIISAIFRR